MKIRISSVTASNVGELINDVTTRLEDLLRPEFEPRSYGSFEQFSAFYISVGSDPDENRPYCEMHNRSGKFKDIVTGKMVSYVSIAIPVDVDCVLSAPVGSLSILLEKLLLKQLAAPAYQLPKKFSRLEFLADLKVILCPDEKSSRDI